MRFENTTITNTKEILYNDHFVAMPYDCSALSANAEGIIPAGTIVPANDATAIGVLLWDVKPERNPNGTIVIHGFVKKAALPVAPADTVDIPMVKFI